MAKDLGYTILFDIYGALLTDKQRETLDLYYNEDLSLGEIAENSGVTRQAVLGCIQSAEERLAELESLMKLAERNREIEKLLARIERRAAWEKVQSSSVQYGYNMDTDEVNMFQPYGSIGISPGLDIDPDRINDLIPEDPFNAPTIAELTEKIRKLL